MNPTNYNMAHECINAANQTGLKPEFALSESIAAQTYATLALVDAIREMRQDVCDTVAEEVSSALIDMKDGAA